EVVAATAAEAAAYDARIRAGVLDGPDVGLADLDPESARRGSLAPAAQIELVRAELLEFRQAHALERVVGVNLASTEAWSEERSEWRDLSSFESALEAGRPQPASVIYAAAALGAGHPFVNFTPNRASSPPALRELARRARAPHCGSDGKTGETLL